MDLSVLLTLPLESIAIRAVLAAAACVVLVRLLLRAGLRAPGARVATAVAPAVTLVAVGLLTWGSLRLPSLMLPVEGAEALAIPVPNGYRHFAPMAVPLLIGVWWLVAGLRLARRSVALVRAHRRARAALRDGVSPPYLMALTAKLAGALRVPSPAVAVVATCPGGALVVGSRWPVVVVGADLLTRLDEDELEGVLAHELAHVKRRDNLVATLVGIVRDLAFFVPGGGWAVRQLHRERELAADQVAVRATGRPGALAGGLLKVLDRDQQGAAHPCAALVPSGSLVDRVRMLVEDQPDLSRIRRSWELVAISCAVATAVVLALVLPTTLAGADRQREAVALMWSSTTTPAAEEPVLTGEARAFDVYRRSSLEVETEPTPVALARHDERSVENRRSTLHACADEHATCPAPTQRLGLGLRPRPVITVDDATTRAWRATPVVSGSEPSDGFRLFWLARVE